MPKTPHPKALLMVVSRLLLFLSRPELKDTAQMFIAELAMADIAENEDPKVRAAYIADQAAAAAWLLESPSNFLPMSLRRGLLGGRRS